MELRITDEVVNALGMFFFGGSGPSHATIERAFSMSGYSDDDPGRDSSNKQNRVLQVGAAVVRRPRQARRFVELMLDALRAHGYFDETAEHLEPDAGRKVNSLRGAIDHAGWRLSEDGRLEHFGDIDLDTGGREALFEQLERLKKNLDDPAAALGTAKDLLESICKFVLQENGRLPDYDMNYPAYFSQATELLKIGPKYVDANGEGGKQLREIYQSTHRIAVQLNELRNLQGTGHGRVLPTGVSPESARFVVRTATHIAELLLSTHERSMGR